MQEFGFPKLGVTLGKSSMNLCFSFRKSLCGVKVPHLRTPLWRFGKCAPARNRYLIQTRLNMDYCGTAASLEVDRPQAQGSQELPK